jgi:hypothetical protein
LTSALDGGKWSASCHGHFTPGWYLLDRRLCGPQSWSERGSEEKNYQPLLGFILFSFPFHFLGGFLWFDFVMFYKFSVQRSLEHWVIALIVLKCEFIGM